MKRLLLLLVLVLLLGTCRAEAALEFADTGPLEDFAAEHAQVDVQEMVLSAISGESGLADFIHDLKVRAASPVQDALAGMAVLLAPALLLAVLGCTAGNGAGAARFAAQLLLLAGIMDACAPVLDAAEKCLQLACDFAEAVVPAVAGLFTAAGMTNSAALLPPAAALAGNIAEEYFLRLGVPLCRYALAVAVAGNLSGAVDLSRLFRGMRKAAGWGVGLSFTLFTAIIALQGGMAASLDSVAMRTAKFAVDSASPLIGSGISDAWESYVCGIRVARSAVGVSGIAVVLLAAAQPIIRMVSSLLAMHALSVFLDIFGEKQAARAAEQAAGVCQMAVELATGGIAIATILLGAAMSVGQGLLG